ncbi:MAG: glycosyltransferase family 2 protein [Phycisphaeraceae bacterium]|nr:glycosyltransferase family 2 protein [Phycisphaeraceae bacterium]
MAIEVAVVIVSYHSRADLQACLVSVRAADVEGITQRVVVVDCASNDGSVAFVRERFPQVEVVALDENLGYAGGNNRGLRHVREQFPGARYLVVLNPDTRVEPGWLTSMVALMEREPNAAVVQAKLRLMDSPDRIDSAGNQSHVLGFGFVSAYGQPDDGRFDQRRELAYASGCAMLVRLSALEGGDLFDDDYFMYLEDAELGWRLRLAGWQVRFEPAAVVYHRHDPRRTTSRHLYYLERNRWRLLLSCYRRRTLLLLAPMLLVAELMVLVYSLRQGALLAKLRSYGSICNRSVRQRRRMIQHERVLDDRTLLAAHQPNFDATAIGWRPLRGTVNACMRVLWMLIYPVIRW